MCARYVFSRLLLLTMLGMAIYAVSHVHGLSDPDQPHTLAERYLQQQSQGGFLIPSVLPLLAPANDYTPAAGRVVLPVIQPLSLTSTSRGPPQPVSAV